MQLMQIQISNVAKFKELEYLLDEGTYTMIADDVVIFMPSRYCIITRFYESKLIDHESEVFGESKYIQLVE